MLEIAQNLFIGILGSAIVALAVWLLPKLRPKKTAKPTKRLDNANSRLDQRRRKGRHAFLIGTFGLFVFAIWVEWVGPRFSDHLIRSDTALLVRKPHWIAYEPQGFDPTSSPNPAVNQIDKQLGWIQKAGFDGIITFTSRGTFDEIPELAKRKHLAVIMGIWDPTNREEIAAAISKQEYVDAYCVGHDGLNYDYSYDVLAKAINHIRFRTQRPVTTTEKLDHYLDDERLLTIGDWLFPDCLLPIRDSSTKIYVADASRDVKETMELANQLYVKAEHANKKPILLKMVGYPYPGDAGCALMTGPEQQSRFFGALIDAQRDVGTSLSTEVSVSAYSAFDLTWKGSFGFYDWEKCTGLLNNDGTARPAVAEIMKRRNR